MASTRLRVTGMTCDHCRGRVADALKSVRGVFSAVVDLAEGTAEIDFDERTTDQETLISAVEATGYQATPAG